MVKVNGPLMSKTASGSIAKRLTFSQRKSGQQVRFQRAQKDVISADRVVQRAWFRSAVEAWNLLTPEQKAPYNEIAKGFDMSGYNYFISQYTPDVPLIPDLIAHYLMNDTDGLTLVDNTVNHLDGVGTYTPIVGKINGASSFDGEVNSVSVPNNALLYPDMSDYSVAFWLNPHNYGPFASWNGLLDMREWRIGPDNGFSVGFGTRNDFADYHKISTHFADGSTGWDYPSGDNFCVSEIPLDDWIHIVVVFARSEGKLKFYLNNVLDNEYVRAFPVGPVLPPVPLKFASISDRVNKIACDFDDVRIYKRGLTSADVALLFNGGNGTEHL